MLKIRASSLGKIMAPAKKDGELSAGAKTYIAELAKEHVYGFKREISSRAIEKGIIVEDDSIELYNAVFFTAHRKNEQRFENEWLCGTPDIIDTPPNAAPTVIDIKSPWSLATFPATQEDAAESLYEWQLRAYMMLTGADSSVLAYCMVDTPEELIGFEPRDMHVVSHIQPELRVTTLVFARDYEKEQAIIERVKLARDYYAACIDKIYSQRGLKYGISE